MGNDRRLGVDTDDIDGVFDPVDSSASNKHIGIYSNKYTNLHKHIGTNISIIGYVNSGLR